MGRPSPTHIDNAEGVARRLREARRQAGLNQRDLAFTGCSPAYVSRIEKGERVPSPRLLSELARRVGVSAEYLARGEDPVATAVSTLSEAEITLALDDMEAARALFEHAAANATDDAGRSTAAEGLGKIALRAGRPAEAAELLMRALALAGGDPSERPALAENLARAYATLGDFAPAIAILEQCVERFEQVGDPVQYVRFAALLGYALTDSGSFAEAEHIVARALTVGREIRDPYTRARLYWSQSRLRLEQGQTELAERYAQRTLEILRTTEDTYAVSHILQTLAQIKLDAGEPTEAMDLLEEGWPLISSAGTPVDIAHYRIEEARALLALDRREEGAALAMEVAGALGGIKPSEAGRAYVLLGQLFEELDEPARARELYELGIEVLEDQAPTRYLVSGYRRLSALLETEGRTVEALAVLKRAVGVQELTGRVLV
jgi:tetratricopeptide (TPR) repeat protein